MRPSIKPTKPRPLIAEGNPFATPISTNRMTLQEPPSKSLPGFTGFSNQEVRKS